MEPKDGPQLVTVAARTIVHPQVYVTKPTTWTQFPKNMCRKDEFQSFLTRQPLWITEHEREMIKDEISRRDQIEYERDVEYDSDTDEE